MNDMINSGFFSLASWALSLMVLIVGLFAWFFVNRASARTNEQIELLEALLEQQKRQTILLRRICEANEPEEQPTASEPVAAQPEDDFIRLVAER